MINSTNKKLQSSLFENTNKKLLIKKKNWERNNKKAIDSYNQRIKENGVFSDGLRQF